MTPSFHAHIYYDQSTRLVAEEIRQELGGRFQVTLGNWHDEPVGPHPESMYQVTIPGEAFAPVTEWLMLNRQGLTVLVHPNTGQDLEDHRDYALWMGRVLPLNLDILQ